MKEDTKKVLGHVFTTIMILIGLFVICSIFYEGINSREKIELAKLEYIKCKE